MPSNCPPNWSRVVVRVKSLNCFCIDYYINLNVCLQFMALRKDTNYQTAKSVIEYVTDTARYTKHSAKLECARRQDGMTKAEINFFSEPTTEDIYCVYMPTKDKHHKIPTKFLEALHTRKFPGVDMPAFNRL